jgi:pimeloyl-ACP methyl ester carboxylesterase
MEKVISKDGTIIAYGKTGSGPALILVDGAMCNSTFGPMPKLIPILSKNFTVVCYDRRGRGSSSDSTTYSPEREIEDIGAMIDSLDSPVFIFGMSSGAILSLMAAAKWKKIDKLVLYEPPFELEDNKNHLNSRTHIAEIRNMLSSGNKSDAVKYFLQKIVNMPSFLITVFKVLPMWNRLIELVNTLPYDLEITNSFTLQILKSYSILTPTLIVYGSKSPEVLKEAASEASERIPNSRIRVLEGESHNVSMKVLAPVLTDFFIVT